MSISDDFKQFVDNGDIYRVRAALQTYLLLDVRAAQEGRMSSEKVFDQFDEALLYAHERLKNLIMPFTLNNISRTPRSQWDKDYLDKQTSFLGQEFSAERIAHVKEIICDVYNLPAYRGEAGPERSLRVAVQEPSEKIYSAPIPKPFRQAEDVGSGEDRGAADEQSANISRDSSCLAAKCPAALIEALESNDVQRVRGVLCACLLRGSFTDSVWDMLNHVRSVMPEVFNTHHNTEGSRYMPISWDDNYLISQVGTLMVNFTESRIKHITEILRKMDDTTASQSVSVPEEKQSTADELKNENALSAIERAKMASSRASGSAAADVQRTCDGKRLAPHSHPSNAAAEDDESATLPELPHNAGTDISDTINKYSGRIFGRWSR